MEGNQHLYHQSEEQLLNEKNIVEAAKKDLKQGTVLCREMLIAKRPGTGISPAMLPWVVGLRLNRDVAKDSLIIKEDLS